MGENNKGFCENSKLTIIALTEKRYKNGEKIWLCSCDCGNRREVKTSDLKKVRSCGCLKGRPKKNGRGVENGKG